jgi:hypothetical protein
MIEDQHQQKETTKLIYYIPYLSSAEEKIKMPLKGTNKSCNSVYFSAFEVQCFIQRGGGDPSETEFRPPKAEFRSPEIELRPLKTEFRPPKTEFRPPEEKIHGILFSEVHSEDIYSHPKPPNSRNIAG